MGQKKVKRSYNFANEINSNLGDKAPKYDYLETWLVLPQLNDSSEFQN